MNEPSPFLSVKAAAAELCCTRETVYGYVRRGELRASAMGTDSTGVPCPPYLIRREDLESLFDARTVRPDYVEPGGLSSPPPEGPPRSRRTPVSLVSSRNRV